MDACIHGTCKNAWAWSLHTRKCSRQYALKEEAESIRQALQTLMPDMANQAINAVEQDKMENATASAMPDDHKIDMAKK